jgi:acetyl esterase/lipase
VRENSLMDNIRQIAPSIALLLLATGCGEDAAPDVPAKSAAPRVVATPPTGMSPAEARRGDVSGNSGAPTATKAPLRKSLAEARRGFATKPGGAQPEREAIPQPPPDVYQLVKYPSPVGKLAAYLTPDPGDGKKHPAIVWITGGDCNSIGDVWAPAPPENDQTAEPYRKAGMVMMFPSLRGGNDNPGRREGFLGEVDDVLAAAEYLSAQPYVDRGRIYLGGHSTGGTLVMLVAEMSDRFRAVFAFGPVGDVRGYGGQFVYHPPGDPNETLLRSPGYWLDSVLSPLFVIEGTDEGNIDALREMQAKSTNPLVRFVTVTGVNHFGILAPANTAIAAAIIADTGPTMGINLSEQKLKGSGR